MKFFARLALVAAALLPFSTAAAAHADSLYLASQSGNSFSYDVLLNSGSSSFAQGSTITLTGLYGVTGVTGSAYANYFGTLSYTSTSVTFTTNSAQSSSGVSDTPLFTITSTSSRTGSGPLFRLNETAVTYVGSAQGPVAPTPEPSTLVLLGSGLLGVAGSVRRKLR